MRLSSTSSHVRRTLCFAHLLDGFARWLTIFSGETQMRCSESYPVMTTVAARVALLLPAIGHSVTWYLGHV